MSKGGFKAFRGSAATAESYLLERDSDRLDDYYREGKERSVEHGVVGVDGTEMGALMPEQFRAWMEHRDPETDQVRGAFRQRTVQRAPVERPPFAGDFAHGEDLHVPVVVRVAGATRGVLHARELDTVELHLPLRTARPDPGNRVLCDGLGRHCAGPAHRLFERGRNPRVRGGREAQPQSRARADSCDSSLPPVSCSGRVVFVAC